MKKIVLNISDHTYEKFMFEAIEQKKDIKTIVSERLLSKPFSQAVEGAFDEWLIKQYGNVLNE